MTNGERYGAYGSAAMFRKFCDKFESCLTYGCPLYNKVGDCRDNWDALEVDVVAEPGPAKLDQVNPLLVPPGLRDAWFHYKTQRSINTKGLNLVSFAAGFNYATQLGD
jgi:hypothetical protein